METEKYVYLQYLLFTVVITVALFILFKYNILSKSMVKTIVEFILKDVIDEEKIEGLFEDLVNNL